MGLKLESHCIFQIYQWICLQFFLYLLQRLLAYYYWVNEYGREQLDLWMGEVMTAGVPQCGKANISPSLSIMNRSHSTHIHNALMG